MKIIKKDAILSSNLIEKLILEKEILHDIKHPFIVGMDYVLQDEFHVYFIMEFIEGGELFRHINQVKRFPEN
jgi:serine/threonine protein kinase